jgi:hypothetical protein
MGTSGSPSGVQGSFLLTPGETNGVVYQGSGYSYALSSPIILCQASKANP